MSEPPHHVVFEKFDGWSGWVDEGFTANFLGVKTRDFLWTGHAQQTRGRFETPDLPAFDEEYFEWIDLLEAVTAARGEFTMMELGAGWGRWLVNAAAAVQQCRPLPLRLVGVEPEPEHFCWMTMHLLDNDIDSSRYELIEAAVAEKDGEGWLYTGRAAEWYGQALAPGPGGWVQRLRGLLTRSPVGVRRVKTVSLGRLLRGLGTVDLIDLDVQGAELLVLRASAEQLDQKVRRVHIGTHGVEIESGLRKLFGGRGWSGINDYPSGQESLTPWGRIRFQDGVQTWINRKLFRGW